MTTVQNRRDFLKVTAAAGAGIALSSLGSFSQAKEKKILKPLERVRVGFVGMGMQGSGHINNLLKIDGVDLVAVCDIRPEKAEGSVKAAVAAGKKAPKVYTGDKNAYKKMCDSEELDLVYTATPWELHVPVMTYAMKTGKHACTEVPAAVTLDECWEMVELSEKTGLHCVMMENCCYDRTELMVLNMVRKGLLGDLLHGECGYRHDLRGLKLAPEANGYWNQWRLDHSKKRNGDLYPTHGLGPVSQCMNINRGNKFDYLVSMATRSGSLNLFAAKMKEYGPSHELAKYKYKLGDVVTTIIRTHNGETIVITHDTNTPRPYSRDYMVQGTKGIVQKYPKELAYIEGTGPDAWQELAKYQAEWEHPLWKFMEEQSKGAGHGGMDFIEDYRLIECLRKGQPTDFDVYDAAAWSCISALSEKSIAKNGDSVKVPDFTRGAWKDRAPLGIITE